MEGRPHVKADGQKTGRGDLPYSLMEKLLVPTSNAGSYQQLLILV